MNGQWMNIYFCYKRKIGEIQRIIFLFKFKRTFYINSLIIFSKNLNQMKCVAFPDSINVVSLTIFLCIGADYKNYVDLGQQGKSEEKYLVLSHHQLVFISVYQRDFTGCDLTETWMLLENKCLITVSRTLLDVKCKKCIFKVYKIYSCYEKTFFIVRFLPLRSNLLHRFIIQIRNIKL